MTDVVVSPSLFAGDSTQALVWLIILILPMIPLPLRTLKKPFCYDITHAFLFGAVFTWRSFMSVEFLVLPYDH